MKRPLIKIMAALLVVMMFVSVLPLSAFAAITYDDTLGGDDYYNVISKKDWELAPGVIESEIVLNNDEGDRRQVVHVVEVDIHNEYTKVVPSSKGMVPTLGQYGTETMDKQAAFAEANGYGNVVAAMNISLSWYNSAYYSQHPELIGEPLGYLVLDGVQYTNSQGQSSGAQTCLVINFDEKDGVARPSDIPKTQIRSTSDAITGWEEQVIPANFGFLVKDGKMVNKTENHTSQGAPRSMLGIKADGTIVMVMNDGRQSPFSAGFNDHEMSEVMLKLGCEYAINGDGGGSSQFLSQRPGEDLEFHCSPSDGAPRDTTHGVLVISTAPATGEFVRATINSSSDYYTPNSEIKFTAIGSDLVGTEAEIPAEAEWVLSDSSYGTISEDGVFKSNGKIGKVSAQLVYDGEIKGEKEIGIVWPTDFAFSSRAMTIPFGKTVAINLVATYNGLESYVELKDGDVEFALSNTALGTINGYSFVATADENVAVTTGTLTGTINGLTDQISISLGKGSEVIFDFEGENAIDGWFLYDYNVTHSGNTADPDWDMKNDLIEIVTAESGKVHSGNSALAVNLDYSDAYSNGWIQYRLGNDGEYIEIKNAKKLGFWIWMPEEAYANEWDLHIRCIDANGKAQRLAPVLTDPGDCFQKQDEAGWRYYTIDISKYPIAYFGIYPDVSVSDYLSYIQFYNYQQAWKDNNDVVNTQGKFTYFIDDITVEYSDAADDTDAPVFGTVNLLDNNDAIVEMNGQTITYNTFGAEVTVNDFVKDNASGLDITSAKAYIDGKEVNCVYSNGRIAVSDITVADGLHTVKFVMCDKAGNLNSVIRQLTVNAGSKIPTVNLVPHDATKTDLPCGSVYYVDLVATNIESVQSLVVDLDMVNTFKWQLENAVVANGFELSYEIEKYENVATIIITKTGKVNASGSQIVASIPVRVWEPSIDRGVISGAVLKELQLTIKATRGILECNDGSISTFTCDPMKVRTEMWMNQWNAPTGFEGVTLHKHTAEAIADKAATCIEAGYTGRTYCAVCDSVVDWGTKIPATGHTYAVVDGKIACECGVQGTDINGLYTEAGKNYYAIAGNLVSGWVSIDDEWYFFDKTTFAGLDGKQIADNNVSFAFDNGRVTTGTWTRTSSGYRYWYGPGYYRDSSGDATSARPYVIDGKTYLFSKQGYMMTGIAHYMYSFSGTSSQSLYYDCGEDGVATLLNGPVNGCFYIEGVKQTGFKLVEFEGNYYFVNNGKLTVNKRGYLSAQFVAGTDLAEGYYDFDETGKIVFKNGPIDGYFYIDGVKQTGYKLVEFEGNYYFINGGQLTVNRRGYLSEQFVAGTELTAGYYDFDETGKIVFKNGPIDGYFYIDGIKQTGYKLVEFEGGYYFINGEALTVNKRGYLAARFVEGTPLKEGYYDFDENGKIIIKNGPIDGYFYVDGVKQTGYKLVEFEGDYYFINGEKLTVNKRGYLSEQFVAGTELTAGYYDFDENGKLYLKNGPINGYFYIDGIMQTGYKLVEFEGDYYFINGGKLTVNKRGYLSEQFVAGTELTAGYYDFDENGKLYLKNGPINGYFYIDGVMQTGYKLVEFEGNYYFINGGKLTVNKTGYLSAQFVEGTMLEEGYYTFDETGKIIFK